MDKPVYLLLRVYGPGMSDEDAPYVQLADLFSGIGSRARLAILMGVYHDRSMQDVADDLGITRSGVQKHLETLLGANLVYRPETGDQTYVLTPIGHFFAAFLDHFGDALVQAVEGIEAAERDAKDEFTDVPLSERALEREVQRRKWELVSDDLIDTLEGLEQTFEE